jgi:hypothetical protein
MSPFDFQFPVGQYEDRLGDHMSEPIARLNGYLKYNIMIELCALNGLECLDITISSEVKNDISEIPIGYNSPTKIIRYDNYQDTLSSLEFFLTRYGLADLDNLKALKCSDEWLNLENVLKAIARGETPEKLSGGTDVPDDQQEIRNDSQDNYMQEAQLQNEITIKNIQIQNGDPCPRCKKGEIDRIPRKKWMYLLPKSKHYECWKCNARFLTLYGRSIRLSGKV